jgi:hypothetical protein
MKAMLYMGLILVFLMFFSRDPMIALIVLGIGIGAFVLFRKKKKGITSGRSGLFAFGKGNAPDNSLMKMYLTMFMLQSQNSPLFHEESSNKNQFLKSEDLSYQESIEKTKQEVLQLLKFEVE